MPTTRQVFLYWLGFIFSEIFGTFGREVTKKHTIKWYKCDKISNIDKRIKQGFYKKKTRRKEHVLELLLCVFSGKKHVRTQICANFFHG